MNTTPRYQQTRLSKLLFSTFVIMLSSALELEAQNWPFELWHEGKIVLVEGDTLRGLIKYDLQQDLVQFELANKRSEAFTARKVLFFEIFDATVQKYRRFFCAAVQQKYWVQNTHFFSN